ncbi:MAG TPA: hypothetical protein PKM88_03135 [bacterium]|nr:hypothetical protein [bacterium]
MPEQPRRGELLKLLGITAAAVVLTLAGYYAAQALQHGSAGIPVDQRRADRAGEGAVVAPGLPLALDQNAAVAVNGVFYSTGGQQQLRDYLDVLLSWRPGGEWQRLPAMPFRRCNHAAAVLNGRVYVLGGMADPADRRAYNDLDEMTRYDPAAGEWTACAPMPTPRNFLCAAVCDGKIYAIGGQSHGVSAHGAVECYDPERDQWQGMMPLPTPRYGAAAAVIDGKIYVVGGAGADLRSGAPGHRRNLYFGVLEIFDPATGRWTAGAEMPTPRACTMTGVIDGRLYVAGGFVDRSGFGYGRRNLTGDAPGEDEMAALRVVESYDPASDSWRSERPLAKPRNRGGAAVLDGTLYLVGGCDLSGATYNDVEAWQPQ